MNKKSFFNRVIFIGFAFVSVFFSSCASKPKFSGSATLTGVVIDELNQPIFGFPISISSGMKKYGTVVTNESGIFFVQNVDSGKLSFSGQKEGFAFLDVTEPFYQKDKIMCFQISSVDAVLNKVDEKIIQGDFGGGLAELDFIYAKWGTPIYGVVKEYEKYCKLENKKEKMKKGD